MWGNDNTQSGVGDDKVGRADLTLVTQVGQEVSVLGQDARSPPNASLPAHLPSHRDPVHSKQGANFSSASASPSVAAQRPRPGNPAHRHWLRA